MTPRRESHWASEEAAIKAEINEAKNALDLMRMAHAIARLDALYAEMEAPQSQTAVTEPKFCGGRIRI